MSMAMSVTRKFLLWMDEKDLDLKLGKCKQCWSVFVFCHLGWIYSCVCVCGNNNNKSSLFLCFNWNISHSCVSTTMKIEVVLKTVCQRQYESPLCVCVPTAIEVTVECEWKSFMAFVYESHTEQSRPCVCVCSTVKWLQLCVCQL